MCILKGIYPREPRKKFKGTNKTYYHVKDIKYLEQDKIMQTMRDIKIFNKKYNRLLKKGLKSDAQMMNARRPKMEFQHIIKERYPSFVDCLKDLDDALCLIFLYSKFPTHQYLGVGKYQICIYIF
jgi:pescadillo protein